MNKAYVKFLTDAGEYRTDTWGMLMKDLKIGTPAEIRNVIKVPGRNGDLDLTYEQNGKPVFGNRSLEFLFDKKNEDYEQQIAFMSTLTSTLQGKRCKLVLGLDANYYYEGVVHVDYSKKNDVITGYKVSADCFPYKIDLRTGNEPSLQNVSIASESGWYALHLTGYAYNKPIELTTSNTIELKHDERIRTLTAGTHVLHDCVLREGDNTLQFRGKGIISIKREGGIL